MAIGRLSFSLLLLCAFTQRGEGTELLPTVPLADKYIGESLEIEHTTVPASGERRKERIRFHRLHSDCWRFDFPRGSSGVFAGLWFTVARDGENYSYARVGFSDAPVAAEEMRPRARGFLEASSHVLDRELHQFLNDPAVEYSRFDSGFSSATSEFGVEFVVAASESSALSDANGRVEWRNFGGHSYLTCFHFNRGTDRPPEPQIIQTMVYQTSAEGLRLESFAQRQGAAEFEVRLIESQPAPADEQFYQPEAFGLASPSKPTPRWIWLTGMVLIVLAATVFIARKAKNR